MPALDGVKLAQREMLEMNPEPCYWCGAREPVGTAFVRGISAKWAVACGIIENSCQAFASTWRLWQPLLYQHVLDLSEVDHLSSRAVLPPRCVLWLA